ANGVVRLYVGHRVGPRSSPYRRLIHQDRVVDQVAAIQPAERAERARPFPSLLLEAGIDDVVNQGRFARPRHTGDANHQAKRYVDVVSLQVVLAGPAPPDRLDGASRPTPVLAARTVSRALDFKFASQIPGRQRTLVAKQLPRGSRKDHFAAKLAGARP